MEEMKEETIEEINDEIIEERQKMRCQSRRFVGFWHYGVVLTYLSVVFAVVGICFSVGGNRHSMPEVGVICLLLSGICDGFDGAVAKTRKNRTRQDAMFGERIDSLSDLIAFGIAPVMIGFGMNINRWPCMIVYAVYILCALVRLAYFDVTEEIRIEEEGNTRRKYYEGLPVTNAGFILPCFFVIATCFRSPKVQTAITLSCYMLIAFAFVLRFKMPKVRVKRLIIAMAFAIAFMVTMIVLKATGVLPHYILRSWEEIKGK